MVVVSYCLGVFFFRFFPDVIVVVVRYLVVLSLFFFRHSNMVQNFQALTSVLTDRRLRNRFHLISFLDNCIKIKFDSDCGGGYSLDKNKARNTSNGCGYCWAFEVAARLF